MSVERSSSREPGKREYDSLLATAASFFEAHDYDQVVLLVEEIPKHERSPAAQRLLRRAAQLADEVADLKVRIDDMVAGGRFKNLKECLERLVEIRPGLKRYEGYLQAINTYRHGAAYKVHRAPDGSVRFDPAGSEWTAGTIALLVLLPLLIFGGLYFAVRAYLADRDPDWTVLTVEVDDATAEVAIDDHVLSPLDFGTQMEVAVGEHDAIVRRTGREVWRQRFRAQAGRRTVLRIRLSGPEPVADVSTEDGEPAEAVAVAEPKQPDPAPIAAQPTQPEPAPVTPPDGTPAATPPPSNLPPPPAVSNDPRYNSGFVATGIDPDGMAITFRALGVQDVRRNPTMSGEQNGTTTFLDPPAAFPAGSHEADANAAEWFHANTDCELVVMTSDGLLHSRFSRMKPQRYKPDPPLPNPPYALLRIRMLQAMRADDLSHARGLASLQEVLLDHGMVRSNTDEFAGIEHLQASKDLRAVHVREGGAGSKPRDLIPLRHFPRLRSLEIYCSQLNPATYGFVGTLGSLRSLSLRSMRGASARELQVLTRLQELRKLTFSEVDFDVSCAVQIARLEQLEELTVDGSKLPFTASVLAPFERLPNLRKLAVGTVGPDGFPQLAKMTNLVELAATGGTDADVAALAGLPRLETLALYQPRFTDAAVPHFARMPALKMLDVLNPGVSRAAVDGLKAQRPEIKGRFFAGPPATIFPPGVAP